jgi:putative transposase
MICNRRVVKDQVMSIRYQMPRLGTRKLYHMLKHDFSREGIKIGRDGLFDLLREENMLIRRKKRYTKTTNSNHWMQKYPNRIKGLVPKCPEGLWVADITYITVKNGHGYLHLITDAYSKKIMGYCLSDNLSALSTHKALKMSLKNKQYNHPLIHHSDRGLQYCSAMYVKTLAANDILISMTEDGSPYDNAIAERINGILKDEFGMDDRFENLVEAEYQLHQSVKLYNNKRPHMSNSLLTPNEMHQQNCILPKSWHKKTRRTFTGSSAFLPTLQNNQK